MRDTRQYASPLGRILLESDGEALTGLWFAGHKYSGGAPEESSDATPLPVLTETARWLDLYFSGRVPGFTPPLAPRGTPFRLAVWKTLLTVPFGETASYAEIARRIGLPPSAARAVGGAASHNPIALIIPCHRIIGADGRLTGYAGGLDRKARLLEMEKNACAGVR